MNLILLFLCKIDIMISAFAQNILNLLFVNRVVCDFKAACKSNNQIGSDINSNGSIDSIQMTNQDINNRFICKINPDDIMNNPVNSQYTCNIYHNPDSIYYK